MKKTFLFFLTLGILFGNENFASAKCLDEESKNSVEALFPIEVSFDLEKLSTGSMCRLNDKKAMVCGYLAENDQNFMVLISEEQDISSGADNVILSRGIAAGVRVEPIDKSKTSGIEKIFEEEVRRLNAGGVITIGGDQKPNELYKKIKVGNAGYNNRMVFLNNEWQKFSDTGFKLLDEKVCGVNAESGLFANEDGKIFLKNLNKKVISTSEASSSETSSDDSKFPTIWVVLILVLGISAGTWYFVKLKRK
ncbi:MAG: hypothetical protein Fur0024_1700 [Patescibacteria group bacterium]